jgi:DNA polymerase
MNKKELIKDLRNEIDEDVYLPPHYFLPEDDKKTEVLAAPIKKDKVDHLNKKKHSKADALKELEGNVRRCKKCQLGLSRLNEVFGVGNPEADVIFVGQGPGWEEDHRGEPFIGRARQLLDKILASIELDRTKVYIANIVQCHPMINPATPDNRGNDRPPTVDEISSCRSYLEEQIKIIKPRCIVTLGNTATRIMLNETKGVSFLRGKFYDVPLSFVFDFDIKVLPTYHPAALLRNPTLKRDTWNDMKMLRDWLKNTK